MAIDVDRVLEEVAGEVGLDDYGDPTFRVGLDRLVSSIAESAAPTEIGWITADTFVRQALRNRLRLTDWIARHPVVRDERVVAPLVIVGLPRTGTTALSHLLAADPDNRSLLLWEVHDSVPPPRTATYWDDPRFVAARDAPDMVAALNPDFKAIHHDPPDMPVECSTTLSQHFASALYSTVFNIPDYDDWLLTADLLPAYRYHESMLQVLQSECPGRWQLKSPVHCYGLDALTTVYPDAWLVQTHRDPVDVVASVCSLVRSLSGTFTDVDHTAYIGRHWPEFIAALVDRTMEFRDRAGDQRFVDIGYDDLVADPIGVVRRLYDATGRTLSAPAEAAMRAHVAGTGRKDRFGKHVYSLDDFGLRREAVAERFAPYTARFVVGDGGDGDFRNDER